MGANQTKLTVEQIDDIKQKTDNKLTEKEIKDWHKGFMNDNPEGWLGVEEFKVYLNWQQNQAGIGYYKYFQRKNIHSNNNLTSVTAPAHPYATDAVVNTALF